MLSYDSYCSQNISHYSNWDSGMINLFPIFCRMKLIKSLGCMTPFCLSSLSAMVTGRNMLSIRHACVVWKRLLRSLNGLLNQCHTVLGYGLIIVASVFHPLRIR